MAMTITFIESKQAPLVMGQNKWAYAKLTFPNPYVVGGIAVTAAEFGLDTIKNIVFFGVSQNATPAAAAAAYNRTTGKILLYQQNEVAASPFVQFGAVDTSGYSVDALVMGG